MREGYDREEEVHRGSTVRRVQRAALTAAILVPVAAGVPVASTATAVEPLARQEYVDPMPRVLPREPGPVEIPRVRPREPGPVPMPRVLPDATGPGDRLVVPLPELRRRR